MLDITGYGVDIGGVGDISPSMGEVSGRLLLAQALARRLITPHGGLFYDLDYGYDVRRHLNAPMFSVGEVSSNIENELEKDERVQHASVEVSLAGAALTIKIHVQDGGGPFDFTLTVSALKARLSP